MMGASALVIGAMFTACSNDDGISADEYFQAKYNLAFEKAFGKVSPNQDWGFGPQGSTRATRSGNTSGDYTPWPYTHDYKDANGKLIASANMNCNEWADPDKYYGGWVVPDALTEKQKLRVQLYFQNNPNLDYKDPYYANFFVQQVYKGGTSAPTTGNHESTAAADGTVHAGSTLNQLTVGAACSHINNFNAGTCTERDVLDNDQSVNGGTTHKDRITLMVNVDDTSCFGYHETGGSNVKGVINHNDKMALVSAATIDAWANSDAAKALGVDLGAAVTDKWNRSFMGFDYELLPESDIIPENPTYAKITDVPNYNNIPYAWDGQKVMILGPVPEDIPATEGTPDTKNDDFDLMPYFANSVECTNATCTIEDGKIVCNFTTGYGSIKFKQGNQTWVPYSKLVIEFEASPFGGTVQCYGAGTFAARDTRVEVDLNNEQWDDNSGPTISTYNGVIGTLNITSVKLIGKTIPGTPGTPAVTYNAADYYYPTYILGDNDADKIMFYSSENTNQYGGTIINLTEDEMKITQDGKTCLNLVKFRQLKNDGYHPISTDLKKWVKWEAACDGYYSDWIVTLTKAERITPDEPEDPNYKSLRIMVEDLSADDANDFDFNDVVFDVEYTFGENEASTTEVLVTVWAAGGTLPLRLNGDDNLEVHKLLNTETNCMTNTHAFDRVDKEGKYTAADNMAKWSHTIKLANGAISKENFNSDVNNYLLVEVQKEDGAWHTLYAQMGVAACKIGCPVGTAWALERHNMNSAFTDFKSWVNNSTPTTWNQSAVAGHLYNAGESVICAHGQH